VTGALAVDLSWTQSAGAETCIDRPALVERVEKTVGHKVFVPAGRGESNLIGRIGAGPLGQGWLAVVEAKKDGETTFRRELAMGGSDCRRLDEAIVLVVALMVDSTQSGGAPLAVPEPAEPIRVAIGPDVAFALGMLPGAAFGFGLSSEVNVAPVWPITLSTHGWPVSRAIENGAGGRLWAWTIGVALCPVAASERAWALFACVGVTGGSIDSTGTQLDVAKSTTRAYAQGEARLGFRFRIAGPLFGATEAGAAVPFARDTYTFTQADGATDVVFQTAAVIPLLHARLEVRVP
jgi:hypothetical protein